MFNYPYNLITNLENEVTQQIRLVRYINAQDKMLVLVEARMYNKVL